MYTWSAGAPLPPGIEVDVFHVNHFGVAAYDMALTGRSPFVFTSHNPFLASDFAVPESRLEHAMQGLVLRRADAIVALAEREAERLGERFGIPRDRFTVIPNGLDLSLYGPAAEPVRCTEIELLAVGQLAPYKGHRYLLEAVASLSGRLPSLRVRIVTHQPELRPEVDALIAELGLGDRVEIEGPLATKELIERYRSCDLLVQPSLAECFPVTVLEAMACGKPVVATSVGGVAEEIGDAGLLVPPADVQALAAALERLAGSPDELRRRGDAGLRRVRERYDGRDVVRRHVDLYASVARDARRASRVRAAASRAALSAYERRAAVARFVPRRLRVR